MADINKRGASDCDGEGGERGERGERGKRGKRGERGESGERGEQGERGHDGKDGHDGATGATGATGPVNLDCNCEVDQAALGGEGTASDPFTIIAPVQDIVFRPNDPQGSHDNVYVTWAETYAAIESVRDRGRIMLEFDARYMPGNRLQIPAGTWNMAGVGWTMVPNFVGSDPPQVEIIDGASFQMLGPEPASAQEFLRFHGDIMQIVFNGRSVANGGTGITPFSTNLIGLWFLGGATQLINTDPLAAPMIKPDPNLGAFFILVAGGIGNTIGTEFPIGTPGSAAPLVDIAGAFIEFEMGHGNIADNALMDSVGGGFYFIHITDDSALGGSIGVELAEDGVAPTYDYPAINPALTTFNWAPHHRDRLLLRSSAGLLPFFFGGTIPPVTSSPYDAAYNELVVVDTTGGAVTVNAPRAFPAKGERVSIKNLTGGANNVTFTPTGPDAVEAGTATVVPGQTKTWVADGYGTWLHFSST